MEEIAIAKIRRDCGTQMRSKIDEDVVEQYAENIASLPPVTVYFDGVEYYLVDGFHRVSAHEKANCKVITCKVVPGTLRDAVLYACGANDEHGLRRSNADKRRAVEKLLRDEEWGGRADRWVAEQAKVSNHLVASVREELFPTKKTTRQPGEFPVDKKSMVNPVDEKPATRTVESKDGKVREVVSAPKKITGGVTFNVEEFADPEPVEGLAKDGRSVPAKLVVAFEQGQKIRGMVQRIGALKTECEELAGSPVSPHFDVDDTRRCLEQTQTHLKNAIPTFPCPRCHGKGSPCMWCSGTGFITRTREGQLSDQDKRWLNSR